MQTLQKFVLLDRTNYNRVVVNCDESYGCKNETNLRFFSSFVGKADPTGRAHCSFPLRYCGIILALFFFVRL